jgi:glycosyltransferase involved in cell wall biosynthesis
MSGFNLPYLGYVMPEPANTGWGNLSKNLRESLMDHANLLEYPGYEDPFLVAIRDVRFDPINKIPKRNGKVIGIGFCEFDQWASEQAGPNISYYDHIICGSRYMQNFVDRIIARYELSTTTSVFVQGVDHSVFCGERHGNGQRPFVVGSFGKYEFRKGQDMVIAAFAEFAKNHDDVYLKFIWNNPWPFSMITPYGVDLAFKFKTDETNEIWMRGDSQASYFTKVAMQQGIPANKIIACDSVSRPGDMAEQYRRCSVGFFPNRLEAGSNLCLQEMISTGIPCIATQAHGHLDLGDSYFPLKQVKKKQDGNGNTYYDPCFGECVTALERAYQDKLYLDQKKVKEISDMWTWDALARHVVEVAYA